MEYNHITQEYEPHYVYDPVTRITTLETGAQKSDFILKENKKVNETVNESFSYIPYI